MATAVKMTGRGARGARGLKGDTGNGANPFPPIAGEDPDDVLDESYMPGDIRRYGIQPDDGIDHTAINPSRVAAWLNSSILPNVEAYAPRGFYNFEIGLTNTDGSRIWFDQAHFAGVVHITGGSSDLIWRGEILTDDRFGIANDASSSNIRLGIVRAKGNSRCIHIAGVTNLEFELLHVENTDSCDLSGSQSNLAAVFIEAQGLSYCRGEIQVDNSQTNGVFINGLNVDVKITVLGYGAQAIDAGTNALQGFSTAQTETGFGVCLHRCTGKADIKVEQSNASPGADTYSVWIPETGTSATPASRHEPMQLTRLSATVGNGNRGVVLSPDGGSFNVVNVTLPPMANIMLRSANTLAASYAGLVVGPAFASQDCYVRVFGGVTFTDFGTVKPFKASAAVTAVTGNFTQINMTLHAPSAGAAQVAELTGTGGVLRGFVDLDLFHVSSSFADPSVAITGCSLLRVRGRIRSQNSINSTALKLDSNTECDIAVKCDNFSRNPEGAIQFAGGNIGCTFGPFPISKDGAATGFGFRFYGTETNCTFLKLTPKGFATGFKKATAPVFTTCAAISCVSTADGVDNTDATDLAVADFPAAAQLGCSNFAV